MAMKNEELLSLKKRIKEKEKEIKATEKLLEKLNTEVDALYEELDNLETLRLFAKIKDKGVGVEDALKMLG